MTVSETKVKRRLEGTEKAPTKIDQGTSNASGSTFCLVETGHCRCNTDAYVDDDLASDERPIRRLDGRAGLNNSSNDSIQYKSRHKYSGVEFGSPNNTKRDKRDSPPESFVDERSNHTTDHDSGLTVGKNRESEFQCEKNVPFQVQCLYSYPKKTTRVSECHRPTLSNLRRSRQETRRGEFESEPFT